MTCSVKQRAFRRNLIDPLVFAVTILTVCGGSLAADKATVTSSTSAEIVSFRPAVSLPYRATTMTVTVNSRVTAGERFRVSVAGRECADPVAVLTGGDGRTIINCTVPVGKNAVETGPVLVECVSSNRTYGSTRDFRFVLPDVKTLSPGFGPVTGGTLLNISGEYLDVAKSVRVFIDPRMECTVVRRESRSVGCLTSEFGMPVKRRSEVECQVRLEFDDGAYKKVANDPFRYLAEPTIREKQMQNFEGIVSGGTRLAVSGTGFGNPYVSETDGDERTNPKVYAEHDGKRYYGDCTVIGDERMDCLTPNVTEVWPGVNLSPNTMPLGFEIPFFGETLDKSLHSTNYRVYPDPLYSNFEANDTAVRINGWFLYTGYQPGELAVRLPDSSEVACDVTTVDEKFIECLHARRSPSVADARELLVSVGGKLNNTVVKSYPPEIYENPDVHSTVISSFSMIFVFVILTLGLLFIVKTILSNSQQQTEKRFIEELRNITAGIDA